MENAVPSPFCCVAEKSIRRCGATDDANHDIVYAVAQLLIAEGFPEAAAKLIPLLKLLKDEP